MHKLLLLLKDGLLATALVFLPIRAAILTIGILVMADLFTALRVVRKRRKKITSSGLKRTVMKLLAYEAALMLGYLVQTYLTSDAVPIVKILGGLIGITELKSILENFELYTGQPLFKTIVERISGDNLK